MEMRACEDTAIGEDLTPPIPPITFSLYDSFLHSHCSSCLGPLISPFLPIFPINTHPIPIPSLLYCSPQCSNADSHCHLSSAEYHLFLILQSGLSTWHGDTSDLRSSLRLLLCFQNLGLLSFPPCSIFPARIGGLMSNRDRLTTRDDSKDGDEFDEVLARIREGGRVMSLARRMRDGGDFALRESTKESVLEEAVLCLVLTNAVEVQVNEERTLGIAVYGPSFSWINHSCSPNACYRFSSVGLEPQRSGASTLQIIASGEETDLNSWGLDEIKINNGSYGYGPSIILRSIKPIKKGDEVCITYTDLLQPKEMRQSELWLKYRFICCCRRCSALPPTYVDCVLQENALANLEFTNVNSYHYFYGDEAYKELSYYLDEAITEYLSVGNPESCCEKIENVLIQSLGDAKLLAEKDQSQPNFKLQPLHHLSLKAYTALASAYKIRGSHILALHPEDHQLKAFEMSRTSAAYSLLLAGAAHHLFLSETSLMATAANFWITAGESLLCLARNSRWNSFSKLGLPSSNLSSLPSLRCCKCSLAGKLEVDLFCCQSQSTSTNTEFEKISRQFLDCVSRFSRHVWHFLGHVSRYFKDVHDPMDFSWLGIAKVLNLGDSETHAGMSHIASYCVTEGCCCGPRCEGKKPTHQEKTSLFQFGVHCLKYGGYLSTICYSHNCFLTNHARKLLHGAENVID